ncbi:MAG: hypothetical protein KDB22_24610 [Planctomycetales bacterium]|nr:hypothetical protein [Planctomycetales bacterium]
MTGHNSSLRLSVAIVLLSSVGCSSLSKTSTSLKEMDWNPTSWFKEEYQRPTTLAAIWTADEMAMANQPVSRGFGGRIYFYNERSQAIPVKGDLMVHGYLTTPGKQESTNVQADKKFTFAAEQLVSHFSPSEIGASYSIWVPWDQVPGYREEVTLIATFKSEDGTVVQGTPAKVFLPGMPRDKNSLPSPKVQQVSYQKETMSTYSTETSTAAAQRNSIGNTHASSNGRQTVRTTTIEVPRDAALNRIATQGVSVGSGMPSAASDQQSFGVQVGGTSATAAPQFQLQSPASNIPVGVNGLSPGKVDLRGLTPPPSA